MLHTNEIRDYILRAPKKIIFKGGRIINTTAVRYRWLSQLAEGPLDARTNRRAGVADDWKPFHNPTRSAIRRNARNLMRKAGSRCLAFMV